MNKKYAKQKLLFYAVLCVTVVKLYPYLQQVVHHETRAQVKHEFYQLPEIYSANHYPAIDIPVNYTLVPFNSIHNRKKHFVIFLVKSAPDHFKRRQAIRKTWGSLKSLERQELAVIFLLGKSTHSVTERLVKLENQCFGDVLQTNIVDSFHNLTKKTLSSFKWILKNHAAQALYYILADDDCVIDIVSTINYLKVNGEPRKALMYCGFMFEKNAGVIRGSGKHSLSPIQYSVEVLPAFCRGVMVVLTRKMVTDLYLVSTVTNYEAFPLEDIMVYGILREKLTYSNNSIRKVMDQGHSLVFYPWDDRNTVVAKMLTKWKSYASKLKWRYFKKQPIVSGRSCFNFDLAFRILNI